jgi:hypothetical protein
MCITGAWHILEFGWRKGIGLECLVLKGGETNTFTSIGN